MGAITGTEPLRAGLEDFLPLLVFAIIWWVSSRRERARRSERPPARAAAGLKPPLPPMGEARVDPVELLRQMLFGGLEMPPPPTEPLVPEPSPLHTGREMVGEEAGWGGEGQDTEAGRVKGVPAPPLPEEVRPSPRRAIKPEAAVEPTPAARPRPRGRVSRRELRRAVVWSEILAPPVSLRDEPEKCGV